MNGGVLDENGGEVKKKRRPPDGERRGRMNVLRIGKVNEMFRLKDWEIKFETRLR